MWARAPRRGTSWIVDETSYDRAVDPERVQALRSRVLSLDAAARLAGLLGLLADPTRARILYALDVVDELCVSDVALALDATEDTVGYALRVLRTAGLVSTRKVGRLVYYRLSAGFPAPLRDHCLHALVTLSRRAEDDG